MFIPGIPPPPPPLWLGRPGLLPLLVTILFTSDTFSNAFIIAWRAQRTHESLRRAAKSRITIPSYFFLTEVFVSQLNSSESVSPLAGQSINLHTTTLLLRDLTASKKRRK